MYGHDADFRLEEIEIAPTSDLAGKTLRQAALHETTGVLLIAIRSKQASSCPTRRWTPRWKRAWYSSPPEHSPSSEHSTTVPKASHSHTQAHGVAAGRPRTADRHSGQRRRQTPTKLGRSPMVGSMMVPSSMLPGTAASTGKSTKHRRRPRPASDPTPATMQGVIGGGCKAAESL